VSADEPGPVPNGPQLNVIALVVADLSASIEFYRQLGVDFAAGEADDTHVSAPLGGGIHLMLDSEESIREMYPDWASAGAGRASLAVQLSTPSDVDGCYTALAADGFGMRAPWDAFWGQRYATVQDPDGTPVDLYAEQPAEAPPADQ